LILANEGAEEEAIDDWEAMATTREEEEDVNGHSDNQEKVYTAIWRQEHLLGQQVDDDD
jgi:hypothetical protein